MLEMSRRRRTLLGPLFAEPAWDMLLELFIRDCRGEKTLTKDVTLLGGHSPSTAIRRTADLIALQLIEKKEDIEDARRSLLSLTSKGRAQVAMLLKHQARR